MRKTVRPLSPLKFLNILPGNYLLHLGTIVGLSLLEFTTGCLGFGFVFPIFFSSFVAAEPFFPSAFYFKVHDLKKRSTNGTIVIHKVVPKNQNLQHCQSQTFRDPLFENHQLQALFPGDCG